jgi:plasmid stabilization system protein ParE
MEIRWLEDALADITEIYRYIAADDPRAAARVVARIRLPYEHPSGTSRGRDSIED